MNHTFALLPYLPPCVAGYPTWRNQMLTVKTEIETTPLLPSSLSNVSPEECMFLDIETTGFRPESSRLYLIGVVCRKKHTWEAVQWIAENSREEAALLRIFSAFSRPFRAWIHFNGERFDLPYLREKYRLLEIPLPEPPEYSADLYQDFRPLRGLLGLKHLNQKALEEHLGYHRKDCFSGGELIQVYRDYCKSPDEKALDQLLLHNLDDLRGMLLLTQYYSYLRLGTNLPERIELKAAEPKEPPKQQTADPMEPPKQQAADQDGRMEPLDAEQAEFPADSPFSLELYFPLAEPVPVPFCHSTLLSGLYAEGGSAKICIRPFQGRLKHFFDNWKEYDYLPLEDQAIHRSVASFVDPAYRRRATAETCYIPKEGTFLPQISASPFLSPAFKQSGKDRISYFEMPSIPFGDDFTLSYLSYLLAEHFSGC